MFDEERGPALRPACDGDDPDNDARATTTRATPRSAARTGQIGRRLTIGGADVAAGSDAAAGSGGTAASTGTAGTAWTVVLVGLGVSISAADTPAAAAPTTA